MDKDAANKANAKARNKAGPSAAEESLSDALNGLERILEHRRATPHADKAPGAEQADVAPIDAQYTIPLLNDVVVPGGDAALGQMNGQSAGVSVAAVVDDDEAYRKLAERLANEIEVIVQARVEEALQEASKDIREQVRNHLEIMLPELVEELNALGRR
jgi:hypothetical protein